jgi:hypothetical protein
MTILIEQGVEHPIANCECCGRATRSLNGYASDELGALAAYFVRWTDGHVLENGADFDFIVGEWGGAPASKRVAVSLAFKVTEDGPQFMIVDAFDRSVSRSELVGRSLARADVIGTPLAQQVFAIVDAIWLQDSRIADLTFARHNHE